MVEQKSKKVLVVEDDEFLANAMRVQLETDGYEIVIAQNGEEAKQLVEEHKPNVVILDLILPKVDGFVFLEEIRNIEEYKKLPIIVASNLGQKEDIKKAMDLGANDYVVKTNLSIEELVQKVKALS